MDKGLEISLNPTPDPSPTGRGGVEYSTVCATSPLPVGEGSGVGLRVAIQGVPGAFHEIAARQFFGIGIEVVPALSFTELFEKAANPAQADAAVLAIENSIAGSILGNYKLLVNSQ